MVWAFVFWAALVALVQDEPVDLALMLPDPAVIETRLESSERENGGAWDTSAYSYRVEVRREGEGGYRTVWRDLDDPAEPAMVMVTDDSLVPNRIVNLDELLKDGSGGEDADALAFLRALPPETLTAFLARDMILAAFGQGTWLAPGETIEYRQPGGSFGSSGALMMNASFRLEGFKPGDQAIVVWTSTLDPVEARKALPGLISDMFGLAGADTGDAEKLASLMANAKFEVRRECRYQIDVPTGLAARVDCTGVQDISVAGERRSQETRLVATQRLVD